MKAETVFRWIGAVLLVVALLLTLDNAIQQQSREDIKPPCSADPACNAVIEQRGCE